MAHAQSRSPALSSGPGWGWSRGPFPHGALRGAPGSQRGLSAALPPELARSLFLPFFRQPLNFGFLEGVSVRPSQDCVRAPGRG